MPTTVTLTCAFETAMTGRLRPALARFWRDRLDVTWVDGPADVTIVLDDRLPDGHAPGSEGYVITQDAGRYTIVGEGLGLAFGVGRLAREALRGPDGPVFPALTADEAPAVPVRGIYFPLHRTGGDQPIAFNAYSALLYDEGRYDDFEAMLVELIFWGMNTIGLWYCEWMPLPGEGAEGKRLAAMYRRVLEIARGWRLRVCLLMTTTLHPFFAPDDPLETHRNHAIPDGLWGKWEYDGSYCPTAPEIRRRLRAYREVLVDFFRPDWLELFPTDPGGCDCPRCAPWWRTYLDLAREVLAPWTDRVPLLSINTWYFRNADVAQLAAALGRDPAINTISTQGAWQESTPARLRIADKLAARGYRIVLWPDITMNGGWGTFGTYPFPGELRALFSRARLPYGILPYTEGRYDDFNKFAMLAFAWQPAQTTPEVTRRVLTGMLGVSVPDDAVAGVAALEKRAYTRAGALFATAEVALDAAARDDWRWQALRFHARYAPLEAESAAALAALQAARAGEPPTSRALAALRRRVAAVERRFEAYRTELPALARRINALQRHHRIGCGTTEPPLPTLRARFHLPEMHALLRAAAPVTAEKVTTSMVDFRAGE